MDEELVFEAVRARVAAGEHLDSMLGLPGVDVGGGGAFRYAPDGRLRRIHGRWEPGFRAARDSGRIPPMPPLTPATPEALCVVEAAVGAMLPALFRRCYLELGDGGFGPGYGLLPVGTGREPGTLLGDRFPARSGLLVEGALLLICHWGCGIASLVDVRDPAGPMWAIDPNEPDNPRGALFQQDLTFAEWLAQWVDGVLAQPAAEAPGLGDAAASAAAVDGPWLDPWLADRLDPWHADWPADWTVVR